MANLVSSDDIEQLLMISLTDDEAALIDEQLEPGAETELETYLRRPVAEDVVYTDTLLLDITRVDSPLRLYLTRAPIKSVQSITLENATAPLPVAEYVVHYNYVEFLGLLGPVGQPSLYPSPIRTTIAYTYRLPYGAERSNIITQVIAGRVAREFLEIKRQAAQANRGDLGLYSVDVEGYRYQYQRALRETIDPDAIGGYTGAEIKMISTMRRRVIR